MKQLLPFFLLLLFACNNTSTNNTSNTAKQTPQYELVKNWPQLPATYGLGQVTGIGIDTSQHIFLFHRAWREWQTFSNGFPDTTIAGTTILELEKENGKVINSWGADLFIMPHGLMVDKENNVWVTDVGLHQVFKFTHDGKLLMKLGIALEPGDDSLHFNKPTDVAVADDGSIYVSDGYGNSRIVKFSKQGNYLFSWGSHGDKPGEFNTPHAIDLDSKGNVYVADRENNRVQEFTGDGKFIKERKDKSFAKLYSVTLNKATDNVLAVDFSSALNVIINGSDIIEFDSTGKLLLQFGRSGMYDGPKCRYHDIAVDNEGNIYTADIYGNRVQKFKKIN